MNCSICDKVFTGIENFKQHEASAKHKKKVEMHKMQSYDTKTDSPSIDELHIRQSLLAIPCQLCSKNFNNLLEYQNHCVSEEHARMVLNKKSKPSSTNNELPVTDGTVDSTNHLDKQMSTLNVKHDFLVNFSSCDICGKSFSGPEPYQQHIASSAHKKKEALAASETGPPFTNNNLECKICVKYFSGPEPYQQHLDSIHHKKKMLATGAPHFCNICDEHFADLELYQQHINTDGHKAKCMSSAKSNLIAVLHCDVCDKQFSGPVPYDQHMKSETHRKKVSTRNMFRQIADRNENSACSHYEMEGPSEYFCEFCKQQCPDSASYEKHVSSIHHARKLVNSAAESKRNEIQNIFSPQVSDSSVEQVCQVAPTEAYQERNDKSSIENIKNFLFGDDSLKINPVNFKISVFQVGEEIDFDQKRNDLNSNDLISDDQYDEEIMYEECPSP